MVAGYDGQKRCFYCNEEIEGDASRCQYCGSLLKPDSRDTGAGRDFAVFDVENSENSRIENTADNNGNNVMNTYTAECSGEQPERKDASLQDRPNVKAVPEISSVPENKSSGNTLGNGIKVFLTVLCTIIPGLGQIAGIIIAIVFMNTDDADRRSFGLALLIASLVFFVVSCLACFIIVLAFSSGT